MRLFFKARGTGAGAVYDPPHLTEAPTDRPVDPVDRAHIDRIVAALVAKDWEAYRRLTSGPVGTIGARDFFDLFAWKVAGLKRVTCRDDSNLRQFSLVLQSRKFNGPDLSLNLYRSGNGAAAAFSAGILLENGFDFGPMQAEIIGDKFLRGTARQTARVWAATKAVRIPQSATDEEILSVLKRWNDTLAAGDYQAALDMAACEEGWTSGDELRRYVETFETGDARKPPHRVTELATARDPRPPWPPGELRRGLMWPEHSVHRDDGKVEAVFTPPLDGFWAPFFVWFELVPVENDMWVLDATYTMMDSDWERRLK